MAATQNDQHKIIHADSLFDPTTGAELVTCVRDDGFLMLALLGEGGRAWAAFSPGLLALIVHGAGVIIEKMKAQNIPYLPANGVAAFSEADLHKAINPDTLNKLRSEGILDDGNVPLDAGIPTDASLAATHDAVANALGGKVKVLTPTELLTLLADSPSGSVN